MVELQRLCIPATPALQQVFLIIPWVLSHRIVGIPHPPGDTVTFCPIQELCTVTGPCYTWDSIHFSPDLLY